MYSLLTNELVV